MSSNNAHLPSDLKQLQSLPLEAKIEMTKQRIRAWYESWERFEIRNDKTGKTRFVTMAVANRWIDKPPLKEDEYIAEEVWGHVYVSFSGGKDSTVLKHIVDSMYDDVPAVFVNTGLEYPEIQKFVKEVQAGKYDCFNPNVEIIRPEMRFDEVIKKYGYPAISKEISEVIYSVRNSKPGKTKTVRMKRLSGELLDNQGNKSQFNCENWKFMLDAPFEVANHCCAVMKKKPALKYANETGRKQIVGTLASESRLRRQIWLKNGCNALQRSQVHNHFRSGLNRTFCTISRNMMFHIARFTAISV